MTKEDFEEILKEVYYPDYTFRILEEGITLNRFLQGSYDERDIVTGKFELQKTRKWVLSCHMTKSEFVQTVFKCVITSFEHRVRENFKYRGKRVFGPHFDVDALWEICADKRFDYRK